jgi:hypothetical protein
MSALYMTHKQRLCVHLVPFARAIGYRSRKLTHKIPSHIASRVAYGPQIPNYVSDPHICHKSAPAQLINIPFIFGSVTELLPTYQITSQSNTYEILIYVILNSRAPYRPVLVPFTCTQCARTRFMGYIRRKCSTAVVLLQLSVGANRREAVRRPSTRQLLACR